MFKGFANKSRQFNGFPNLNFQVNNEAYGFSGCTFWLDAAYGTNTQTDLAAVSSWQDKIRGITYTQTTVANQPRYNATNASYNNLPTIESQGTSRYLLNTVGTQVGQTVAFVANYNTILNINPIFAPYNTGATSFWVVGLGGSSASVTGVFIRISNTSFINSITENSSVKIVVITPSAIYVNGVLENSNNNQIADRSCNLIMSGSTGITDSLNGHMAEMIFWNTNYAGKETIISDRLNSKYAIY